MVLKFLTAGLIAAVLAAAAVYYSLDAQTQTLRTVPSAAIERVPQAGAGTDHYTLDTDDDPATQPEDTDAPDVTSEPDSGSEPDARPLPGVTPTSDDRVRGDRTDFDILVEQAGALELVDMRDDAYLTLLDWALRDERYDDAIDVVGRLSAPELRDTARQRIGISHAVAGRMDEAFAVLEQVEIDPLRDAIRLEIIRAATRDE